MLFTLLFLVTSSATACPLPGPPKNGRVVLINLQETNGTVEYICNRGFVLLGHPNRTCSSNGSWRPRAPPLCAANVATHRESYQSSSRTGGQSRLAVDGKRETCSSTHRQTLPSFVVDLRSVFPVVVVKLDFPAKTPPSRLTLSIRVGNLSTNFGNNPACNVFRGSPATGHSLYLPCSAAQRGRYVSLHLRGVRSLSICELEVYSEKASAAVSRPVHAVQDDGLGDQPIFRKLRGLSGAIGVITGLTVLVVSICVCCTSRRFRKRCCGES
ncbi:unnamed protein product, partial [Ixodes hexagonus]